MPKIAVPPKNTKKLKTFGTARGTLLNITHLKIDTTKSRKSLHVHESLKPYSLDSIFSGEYKYVIKINMQPMLKIEMSHMSSERGSSNSKSHKGPKYIIISDMHALEPCHLKCRSTAKNSNSPNPSQGNHKKILATNSF
jgi:hypothetical protein